MPENKATVTNPPVTEPGANGDGKISKEDENRIRENLRSEYNREATELSDKLTATEQEKVELESRISELTNAEKSRLNQLDGNKQKIEAQIHELETNPDYAGYNEKINRVATKVKEEAVTDSTHETSKLLMQEFVDRKAEQEGITPKQLRDELNLALKVPGTDRIKYPDLMPHERVKAAYSDRKEAKRIQQLEDDNKRLKAERDGFSEDGSRIASDGRSSEQLREAAVSGDQSAGISFARDLDRRQAEYEASLKK